MITISHLDHLVLTVADVEKPAIFTTAYWVFRSLHFAGIARL